MIDFYKDFCRQFEKVASRHSYDNIFSDFLTMTVCAFHPQNIATRCEVPDQENEALYMGTIARYKKEETREIAKLLPILMAHQYENEYGDLLGRFFEEYITRGHNGQFFTPETICDLMAQMTIDTKATGQRFNDCACGSGRNLLAAAKIAPNNFFYGADVDANCAKMTAVNFFLNGLRGEVSWMNSLSLDWYGGWQINMNGLGIAPIRKEQSVLCGHFMEKQAENEPAAPPVLPSQIEKTPAVAQQLSLF